MKFNRDSILPVIAVLVSVVVITVVVKGSKISTYNEQALEKEQKQAEEEEKQAIIDMLAEQGIDKDKLEDEYTQESGATILGDALPAKAYRTLAEAEKEFGYYLGYHNQLESLSDYELVDMHIINDKFMQGTYENSDSTKTISVKTSKEMTAKELVKVYKDHDYAGNVNIQDIEVNLAGKDSETLNLAYFSVPNGKSYSINTEAGLSAEDMSSLITELIDNLKIMDDWEE